MMKIATPRLSAVIRDHVFDTPSHIWSITHESRPIICQSSLSPLSQYEYDHRYRYDNGREPESRDAGWCLLYIYREVRGGLTAIAIYDCQGYQMFARFEVLH